MHIEEILCTGINAYDLSSSFCFKDKIAEEPNQSKFSCFWYQCTKANKCSLTLPPERINLCFKKIEFAL